MGDVLSAGLVLAGTSLVVLPSRGFVEELVKESVNEMQKQGLAQRQPR